MRGDKWTNSEDASRGGSPRFNRSDERRKGKQEDEGGSKADGPRIQVTGHEKDDGVRRGRSGADGRVRVRVFAGSCLLPVQLQVQGDKKEGGLQGLHTHLT